jgi:rubredoxin
MATYKCRKCGHQEESVGKPKTGHCGNSGWDMVVRVADSPKTTLTFNQNTYDYIGTIGAVKYYGRIDRDALDKMDSALLDTFEVAMKKGVLDKKSTGSDGVKLKETGALIKLSIRTAKANEADNCESLWASYGTNKDASGNFYLNFDGTVERH